jgi:hypothetical protein
MYTEAVIFLMGFAGGALVGVVVGLTLSAWLQGRFE